MLDLGGSDPSSLQAAVIFNNIDPPYHKVLSGRIKVFQEINSTNDYLLGLAKTENIAPVVCVADRQFHGRGRLGREWHSLPGNIYLSILWNTNLDLNGLSGLNIVVSIAIVKLLEHYGVKNLYLKWPNDIIYEDGKLGGILIENIKRANGNNSLVIGVGINLLTNNQLLHNSNYSTATLAAIIQGLPNRNVLIGKIISKLLACLEIFANGGLSNADLELWNKYNYQFKQEIKVKIDQEIITGINLGINHCGNLKLSLASSKNNSDSSKIRLAIIHSGEIIINDNNN